MKITKYRTVALIYPWLLLEAEAIDGDETYYVNVSVNDKGKKEVYDDNYCDCWAYDVPLDIIEKNDVDFMDKHSVWSKDCDKVAKELIDFWNENPVFDNSLEWKEWKTHETNRK